MVKEILQSITHDDYSNNNTLESLSNQSFLFHDKHNDIISTILKQKTLDQLISIINQIRQGIELENSELDAKILNLNEAINNETDNICKYKPLSNNISIPSSSSSSISTNNKRL